MLDRGGFFSLAFTRGSDADMALRICLTNGRILGRIRSIGDALHPTHDGHLPALLVDQVNLSVQP